MTGLLRSNLEWRLITINKIYNWAIPCLAVIKIRGRWCWVIIEWILWRWALIIAIPIVKLMWSLESDSTNSPAISIHSHSLLFILIKKKGRRTSFWPIFLSKKSSKKYSWKIWLKVMNKLHLVILTTCASLCQISRNSSRNWSCHRRIIPIRI